LKASFANALRRWLRPLGHPVAAWSLLTGYAGLIFGLSSQSIGPDIELFPHADKLYHLIEYSIFGALAAHALQTSRPQGRPTVNLLMALALGAFYGASDEWHQYFVPAREASPADLLMDVIGAGLGAWFFYFAYRSSAIRSARLRIMH
jgi:VanZ family protein